jgi:transposase InsO family protein
MARREVQDMVRRFRRLWRSRNRLVLQVLHWQRPGSIWAIDFAKPPASIDGCFAYVLAVRDLASNYQVLWLPVTDETAQTAIDALTAAFHEHGPPLVLKSDNGSAFLARETTKLLVQWRVCHLRSPPDLPEYNGSCEAGIGSMKTRTHHQARRRGYPGEWTCDDVEAARLQANQTARPWGCRGPTPDQVWQQRRSIKRLERRAFAQEVQKRARKAKETEADRWREALVAALEDHGLLRFGQKDVAARLRVSGRKTEEQQGRL